MNLECWVESLEHCIVSESYLIHKEALPLPHRTHEGSITPGKQRLRTSCIAADFVGTATEEAAETRKTSSKAVESGVLGMSEGMSGIRRREGMVVGS